MAQKRISLPARELVHRLVRLGIEITHKKENDNESG